MFQMAARDRFWTGALGRVTLALIMGNAFSWVGSHRNVTDVTIGDYHCVTRTFTRFQNVVANCNKLQNYTKIINFKSTHEFLLGKLRKIYSISCQHFVIKLLSLLLLLVNLKLFITITIPFTNFDKSTKTISP